MFTSIPIYVIFGLALFFSLQRVIRCLNVYCSGGKQKDSGGTFFGIVLVVLWSWFFARMESRPVPPLDEIKVTFPQQPWGERE